MTVGAPSPPVLLKVAVVVDGQLMRRWQSTAIAEIEQLGFCRTTIFACVGRSAARHGPAPRLARLRAALRHALYGAYIRADRHWFGNACDPLGRMPAPGPDAEASRPVRVQAGWPSPMALAREDLDVIVCLAPGAPAERLASSARFGAWSLQVGGTPGPADLFTEVNAGEPATPVTLRARATDGERVVCRSYVQSDRASLHRGRCVAYQRAARLPARGLRDLRRHGEVLPAPGYDEPLPAARTLPSRPANATMMRFILRVAAGAAGRRILYTLADRQWFLAYRRHGPGPPFAGATGPFTTIAAPSGHFYADPFLLERDGRHYVLYEDFDQAVGRADIRSVEIDEHGRLRPPRVALQQDCHLSYPFVFADGDAVYMLPETGGRRTVELWRASHFPGEWTLERIIMEGVYATDATLLRHDGRLWLFLAIDPDGRAPIDELFLFSSDSLQGEWEPHPMNPVVSDVRFARPAGRILVEENQLIRPAQDCSRQYGWRLVFNRIETLTPTEYGERPIGALEPVPRSGNLRTHSYGSDGTYEIVDGCRLRPKLSLGGFLGAPSEPRWQYVDLESSERPQPSRSRLLDWT